ncbi:MAG: MoxR family ATPase [Bacillota bacterium]|nr:MoxR family ATPase [Bacillota bacterium]
MDDLHKTLNGIVENVEKVLVGKRDAIEKVLITLLCGGHVLIEDTPGVGKTSLASAFAKSISATFKRIQFNPDILPSDITGFSIYNQKTGDFEYKPGSIMSQLILADEINRTSPKTQSSLLEVMEENQVTVDGITYPLPKPFMVLATQNSVEYLGTYPLPEAQIDRFFMKISMGYPTVAEESQIISRYQYVSPLEEIRPIVDSNIIIQLQEKVKSVHVDKSLNLYIAELVGKTRLHPHVSLGASPRGSLSLFRAAQAWALYSGRDYVLPDDIKKMSVPVLHHRIIQTQESELKNISPADIINSIIENTRVPMVDYDEIK